MLNHQVALTHYKHTHLREIRGADLPGGTQTTEDESKDVVYSQ